MKNSKIIRLICVVIALLMVVLTVGGCGEKGTDKPTSSAAGDNATADKTDKKNNFVNKYFDTDLWEAVPLISQELIDAGYENSEACQVSPYCILDPIDGKLGFYGTDVGGMFRTTDGGKSWHPSTVGFAACGSTGMMFDPNNIERVIAIGCNSGYHNTNGIYLSTDAGDNWKAVFVPGMEGFEGKLGDSYDHRVQIAFDPTTNDKKLGGSKVVYWSRETKSTEPANNKPFIYKSTDGGESWKKLQGTENIGGGDIFVNTDGKVIASNKSGVWTSTDGGKKWNKVSDLSVNAMFALPNKPNNVYIVTLDEFYTSTDFGKTFNKVDAAGFPTDNKELRNLRVAPSNPDYMMFFRLGTSYEFDYASYYTKDGGKTWAQAINHKEGIWIPMSEWRANYWYSPVDENYIIATEYRSEDGGENFYVSTKGYNVACATSATVNINNDKLIATSNQDFNGGFSVDGGKTWKYVNWSGKNWGGFTYGSYCLTDKIAVTTNAESWDGGGEIVYTTDGGNTVQHTGINISGLEVGYGAVGKDNICFMAEYRTEDYCQTWTKMEGCKGVLAHDSKTGRLFGADTCYVVYSDDDGKTWQRLTIAEDTVSDIDYNERDQILYVTAGQKLFSCNLKDGDTAFTQIYGINANHVAHDPENPSILYVTYSTYSSYDVPSVCRSLDGGKTWTNLCRTVGDGRDNCLDGGRQAGGISFIASTREIMVATGCRGIWKMKACDASEGAK